MSDEIKGKVVRGKINGREIYCRIPIRRKRTPITQDDIDMFESIQKEGVSDKQLLAKAYELIDIGLSEFAGKIFSYIDMKRGQPFAMIEEDET